MGHRINVWVQPLLVPGAVIATLIFLHFGFSVLKILAIVLPIFAAVMLFLIVVDPGPRAKEFVEGLRNQVR